MRGLLAGACAVGLLASGCAGPAATSRVAPSGSGSASASEWSLEWAPCGEGLDCARLVVPVDYDHPDGARVRLPVTRRKATAVPAVGTLVVDPGGPGASGAAFVAAFPATGLAGFDIVGWDRRGVGVSCLSDAEADRFAALDASPNTAEEAEAYRAGVRTFAQGCLQAAGGLMEHASTRESALDLERLRMALGVEQVDVYAASYGALLGVTYDELFPGRVRRLVLDSPVDLTKPEPSVAGFERLFDAFADWCVAQSDCRWGSTPAAVRADLLAWVEALDARPMPVGDRALTQTGVGYGMMMLLYGGPAGFPELRAVIEAAWDGQGEALLAAADAFIGRQPGGGYAPIFSALPMIYCADHPRRTWAEIDQAWQADRAAAPFFGYLAGPDVTCLDWPGGPQTWTVPTGSGGAETLILAGSEDPVAPLAAAQELAVLLPTARLLTVQGGGHGAYGHGGCAMEAAVGRLDGREPPATCGHP